jgi:hypothetical protein
LHNTFLETLYVLEEDLLLGLVGLELLLLMPQLAFEALEIDAKWTIRITWAEFRGGVAWLCRHT